jgi:hypothetical protein
MFKNEKAIKFVALMTPEDIKANAGKYRAFSKLFGFITYAFFGLKNRIHKNG